MLEKIAHICRLLWQDRKVKTGFYLWSIWQSWDKFRCHPIWRPNQRLSTLDLFWNLGTEAEVRQLYLKMFKKIEIVNNKSFNSWKNTQFWSEVNTVILHKRFRFTHMYKMQADQICHFLSNFYLDAMAFNVVKWATTIWANTFVTINFFWLFFTIKKVWISVPSKWTVLRRIIMWIELF